MAQQTESKSTSSGAAGLSYADAGVDIKAGEALVDAITPLAEETARPGVLGSIGGFGALFDLKEAGFSDPILVSATDGVGTKLKVAQAMSRHSSIGIDLVAMCVNDLLAQGADPLFFLDYFATGHLHPSVASQVVAGVGQGCLAAGCALVGGETAELPGLYGKGIYDLAGFAVGAVERDHILPRKDIEDGDLVLGLRSSGAHSNGFSLIRKIVEDYGHDLAGPCPFQDEVRLGDALLEPTKIYVKPLLGAVRAQKVKALAHITGGGITGNVPRILPDNVAAAIDLDSWEPHPVFTWLKDEGKIDEAEMLKTFNCGIGMVVIAPAEALPILEASLTDFGEELVKIGEIVARDDEPVVYSGQLFKS